MNGVRRIIFALTVVGGIGGSVGMGHAQTLRARDTDVMLNAAAGLAGLWDDETMLGRGLTLSGGLMMPLGDKVTVGGDVNWLDHHRRSGYLEADGSVLSAFGHATYLFGSGNGRVRPIAGAGIGLMRSRGTFTIASTVLDQNGRPVPGPSQTLPWALTRPAWEAHTGARIVLHPRLAVRPEVRWVSTFGRGGGSGIEPPLWRIETLAAFEIRLR